MEKAPSLEKLTQFFKTQRSVSVAIVFGSVAEAVAGVESDVDIAIKTKEPLSGQKKIELIQLVAALLGRPVDLIDLNKVGEPLLGQIIQYGKLIKRDKTAYAQLALRHLYAKEDFMPYLRRSLNERRERWINYHRRKN